MKTSSFQVSDGEWHHAALVYDGKCLKLYVDGVFRKQKPMTGNVSDL